MNRKSKMSNEERLDAELKRLHNILPFLWQDHEFHIAYLTRDHGPQGQGFILGLENASCRLLFARQSGSQTEAIRDYVGIKTAPFHPPNRSYSAPHGWYPLSGLITWLTGVDFDYVKDVDRDLENLSEYLKLYLDLILDVFSDPAQLQQKLQRHQNAHKDKPITVPMLKEERARLQAAGQDSSLEAALTNLRGGKR
jgi:hypothetical protein